MREFLDLYWTMFKIGICTFGGGYAMMAILERELAGRRKWISSEELLDYMAIGQITPGIIAVNVSTFVGRKRKGIPGGIISTLGVISPSIVIIMIIAAFLVNFQDNEYVQHAFAGIRVCVGVLIVNAAVGFIKKTVVDLLTLSVFLCIFILAVFTRIETVYFILGIIIVSVILTLVLGERFYREPRKQPESDRNGKEVKS
ncbi:MAG: chromate transporter [Parasporobacterium sp.]|nr:chromate transporter [Parasporobacterium sp.]